MHDSGNSLSHTVPAFVDSKNIVDPLYSRMHATASQVLEEF